MMGQYSVKQKMLQCALPYLTQSLKLVEQAERSVLILRVNNCSRIVENLCKQYGEVKHTEIISSAQRHSQQMALVEFAEEEHVQDMIRDCVSSGERWCFESRLSRIMSFQRPRHVDSRQTSTSDRQSTKKKLNAHLRGGTMQLGDCIRAVKETTELSDTALRCHYLQCKLIDDLMSYHMPEVITLPHGSVLSGLATVHSDLDMVLHPFGLANYNMHRKVNKPTGKFQASFSSASLGAKADSFDVDMINYVAFALRYFGKTFCRTVVPLPQAKHPIVRFVSALGFGNCDLTAHLYKPNEGILSSCMLQMICDSFPDFQSLSHCLRFWARERALTSSQPGKFLINFTLTHLLIYYLQEMKLLPSIQDLTTPDVKVDSLSTDPDALGVSFR
ncbi:poly(A) RNA polymerase, mitochondrial-like isoform X2 [Watersipora subatra]|uniref:poly(A) RNA polymerase, mitochondrial-like isoform X2 n=1 Tax=Watersipora subatra TaxID=2589382 RepID=UPI00355C913D